MTKLSLTARREAEQAFRKFSRETNMLVAGRKHAVVGASESEYALVTVLRSMGGQVRSFETAELAAQWTGAIIHSKSSDYLGGVSRRTGAEKIDWAKARMPVVAKLSHELASRHDLKGLRIGACLVLEPKTAVLALSLQDAGAEISVYAPPHEVDWDVSQELKARGIPVFAKHGDTAEDAKKSLDAFLGQKLNLLIDDGGRAIRRAHNLAGALDIMIGAAEETTSGLRNLAKEPGGMRIPVIAVNDAFSKTWFDNAVGTGQSCVSTILDLIDESRQGGFTAVGANVVVVGYGPVGQGTARHLAALGANVTVVDIDPRITLKAAVDGYQVSTTLIGALSVADLVISATGYPSTITAQILRSASNSTVFAVAGGVDEEIEWKKAIDNDQATWEVIGRDVEDLVYPDGHRITILDRGNCINCSAGEGNPIEIMDLSFGVQISALDSLLTHAHEDPLKPGVHPIGIEADQWVAETGLIAITGSGRGLDPQ